MRQDLCILIPTCDRYLPVARWTQSLLARHWSPLPPVFLCGSTAPDSLPLQCDSRDWILIALQAVEQLDSRGFKWIYLILDDHPPIGPCHSVHLNETLPAFAESLSASHINLLGRREDEETGAVSLGEAFLGLERNLSDYEWKYSLHPGLWSVAHLLKLLRHLVETLSPDQRTPWIFESHDEDSRSEVARAFADSTYRVNGQVMALHPSRAALDRLSLQAVNGARRLVISLFGNSARSHFNARFVGFEFFNRGPYPIFWSGAIHKGGPRFLFSNFLFWSGKWRMWREFQGVSRSFVQR
jgi:hypothetical protein